jgi:hypothetical protein
VARHPGDPSHVKLATLALLLFASLAPAQNFLSTYKGAPYTDAHHPVGAQPIPGIVQCAYYDRGGEGIA